MTTMQHVPAKTARAIYDAVKQVHPPLRGHTGPALEKDWDWTGTAAPWAIVWEDGPYDWALNLDGGVDEEVYFLARDAGLDEATARSVATVKAVTVPKGYRVEPITSWALGIFPA